MFGQPLTRYGVVVAGRRTRSRARGPKNQLWASLLFDEQAVAATAIEGAIVAAADWAVNTGTERGTILRTHGWVCVSRDPTDTGNTPFFMMIYLTDKDTGVVDPSAIATYSEEDILWVGGTQYASGNAGAVEGARQAITMNIDVKSMRRITQGQELRFCIIAGDATGGVLSAVFRSLVRIGGN